MTPLHLAALKNKLNAAHLLVEANADLDAFNEERKRPLDLCGNNAPMRALLTSHNNQQMADQQSAQISSRSNQNQDLGQNTSTIKERTLDSTSNSHQMKSQLQSQLSSQFENAKEDQSGGNQVLPAAKDLLSSTIDPVTAYEETIILACEKVESESNAVTEPDLKDYQAIKQSLEEYKRVSEQFLNVLHQVQKYRGQLKGNKANVSEMSQTIDQTEMDLSFKLQKKRTSNAEQTQRLKNLTEEFYHLQKENEDTTSEINFLEKRLRELKEHQAAINSQLEKTKSELSLLTQSSQQSNKNETEMAIRSESLQATKSLIHNGDSTLAKLEKTTDDRLLNAGISASNFLRRYKKFVTNVLSQLDERADKMRKRVEKEKRNQGEIKEFQLKMDETKIAVLINDYEMNYDRFIRRKEKIHQIMHSINDQYEKIKQMVGEFGQELEPLE